MPIGPLIQPVACPKVSAFPPVSMKHSQPGEAISQHIMEDILDSIDYLTHPSIHPSIHMSIHLSIYIYLSLSLSIYIIYLYYIYYLYLYILSIYTYMHQKGLCSTHPPCQETSAFGIKVSKTFLGDDFSGRSCCGGATMGTLW